MFVKQGQATTFTFKSFGGCLEEVGQDLIDQEAEQILNYLDRFDL